MNSHKDQHHVATDPRREDDEVGYRKPPAAFRFKKGVSGNPKGRPPRVRKADALRSMLEEVGSNEELDEVLNAWIARRESARKTS
jgi:hypothetical protein